MKNPEAAMLKEIPLEELTLSHWTELRQCEFAVQINRESSVNLKLTLVTASRQSGTQENFALLFEGPTIPALDQRTYRFSHEKSGWFDLFIVPVGAASGRRQYEAVFNRQIPDRSGG